MTDNTTVTLCNLYLVSNENLMIAADKCISDRKEIDPMFGKYKPNACAKRFETERSRINALSVCIETLRSMISLELKAEINC